MDKKIIVYKGNEYRAQEIDNIYENDLFFSEQYRHAAICIDEIVQESEKFSRLTQSNMYENMRYGYQTREEERKLSLLMGYPNNIIGFCGRRGSGKTSSMLAISDALRNMNSENQKYWKEVHSKNVHDNIVSSDMHVPVWTKRYHVIEPIDPTTVAPGVTLLSVILHKLFEKFQRSWKANRNIYEQEKKNPDELLRLFEKAFTELDDLKTPDRVVSNDILTELSEVGDSVGLRRAFSKLVETYLRYMGYDFLVVQIDDADMNPSRSYEFFEDIRKFLQIPHVIVLLAIHMNTMRRCVEQEYVKQYEFLLRGDFHTSKLQRYKCAEMAERYIEKLIPGYHQIHLPYFDDKAYEGFDKYQLFYYLPEAKNSGKKENLLNKNNEYTDNYIDSLIRLIYQKTGLILFEPQGYFHNFLPIRFRELTHFLSFFSSLPDIDVDGDGSFTELLKAAFSNPETNADERKKKLRLLEIRYNNLLQLEIYFREHWCTSRLTTHQCLEIGKLMKEPLSIKNATAIACLREYCSDPQDNKDVEPDEFKKLGINRNSYAAVIKTLKMLKGKMRTHAKHHFLYATEFYYSIFMNKVICSCMMDIYDKVKAGKEHEGFDSLLQLIDDQLFIEDIDFEKGALISIQLYQEAMGKDVELKEKDPFLKCCKGYKLKKGELVPCDIWWKMGNNYELNWDLKFLKFSYTNAILGSLEKDKIKYSVNKEDSNESENLNEDDHYKIISNALHFVSNYDMQYRFKKVIGKNVLFGEGITFETQATKYYNVIDEIYEGKERKYLNIKLGKMPQSDLPLESKFRDVLMHGEQENVKACFRNADKANFSNAGNWFRRRFLDLHKHAMDYDKTKDVSLMKTICEAYDEVKFLNRVGIFKNSLSELEGISELNEMTEFEKARVEFNKKIENFMNKSSSLTLSSYGTMDPMKEYFVRLQKLSPVSRLYHLENDKSPDDLNIEIISGTEGIANAVPLDVLDQIFRLIAEKYKS